MVDISIIVPIYNVEKYLRKCVDSILAQTFINFELILVNDGSPDNSGKICEEYKEKDNRIKVIHQKNQGTGIARNSGIDIANGKYIYFCDPDDYVESTLLEDNFKLAEEYNANMVIFGYYDEIISDSGTKTISRKPKAQFLATQKDFRDEFKQLFEKKLMYTLWNKLYRKEFLDKNNCRFENQRVGQDTVFNYFVYGNLDRIYINDKEYYHYIVNRVGSAVNKYREDRFDIRYKETIKFEELLNKWGYQDSYKHLILNDWIKTVSIGLNNLFYDQCPLSKSAKKEQIEMIVKRSKINYLLENMSQNLDQSTFMKITLFLLKKGQVKSVYYLLQLKKSIKGRMK